MAAVAFYHLTASTAGEALPQLVGKTLAAEKNALICCDKGQMMPLSTALWSHGEGSWLPHGLEGQDDDDAALCPVWITTSATTNPNQAAFVFFVNAASLDGLTNCERGFVLFDGGDDAAVTTARGQWKSLRADGHELSYWTQDAGGAWAKTA